MRRAVRVGLVVLGAALTLYGIASASGRWLGTPPWWPRYPNPAAEESPGADLSIRAATLGAFVAGVALCARTGRTGANGSRPSRRGGARSR